MSQYLESILVGLIVTAAVFYICFFLGKSKKKKGCACGDGCGGCTPSKQTDKCSKNNILK